MKNQSSEEDILKRVKDFFSVQIREIKNISPADLALREARSMVNRHFLRLF